MHDAGRDRLLADLRTRIARLEQSQMRPQEPLPFGVAAMFRFTLPGDEPDVPPQETAAG